MQIMKKCARCSGREVVLVIIKKEQSYLHVEWVCLYHLLQLIERMNRMYPDLDYVAKVRAGSGARVS
jgi:hypothetical protein